MTDRSAVEDIVAELKRLYSGWGRTTAIETMRREWDEFLRPRALGSPPVPVDADGVTAAWIAEPGCDASRVILFLHGGGFRLGSIVSHLDLMQRLSASSGARVLALEYRLAPEHVFPAPVEDALVAYRWLLRTHPGARVAFAGDSAGGGLCIAAMVAARAAGDALPRAAVLMSALTDLTAERRSYTTHAALDPIHNRALILAVAKGYLGEADPRNPLASPIFGDLAGLPPLLIQCGERETVLDDSRDLAAVARAAGVSVMLEIYDGMIHVFQTYCSELAAARAAVASAGRFLEQSLSA